MANMTNEVMSKSNGMAKPLERDLKDQMAASSAAIGHFAHDVGERAGQMTSKISNSVSDYYESGRDFVRDNPVKGVAYAAAAGVVAGGLLAIALRRSH